MFENYCSTSNTNPASYNATTLAMIKLRKQILCLHGQFRIVLLPYMDNEWSGSERDLLSQRPEWANALATLIGRRLVNEVYVVLFAR